MLQTRTRSHLFAAQQPYYREPLTLVEGHGTRVRDSDGREYLDGFAGIATLTLGHAHPEVTRAVSDQAGKLVHTSTLYDNEPLLDLVELLADVAPKPMSKVFVANSGSEANEVAALIAKTARNSQEILALDHAYHGRTLYTVAMAGMSNWRNFGVEAANVAFVPNAYCYRCPLGLQYPSCEIACARSAKRVIETQTSGYPAALIAETIEGVGGIITPPPEYFKVLQETLAPFGTLLIADEVQTAWGRLGDGMFGMPSTYGVVPDIITSAKGLANGLPISVTITRPELADAFKGPHINTFGGNPLSARAARVTLEVVQRERLIDNAKRQGHTLLSELRALQDRYPLIGEVRGHGLMIGVEFVKDRGTKEPATSETGTFLELMRERGLLVGRGGRWSSVVRIQPPLIFDDSDTAELLRAFESSLATLR